MAAPIPPSGPLRLDGRLENEIRKVIIHPSVSEYAEGSVIVEFGKTKVLVTASYDLQPPKWLQGTGQGWVTAEYGMLPRATQVRTRRDKNLTGGRSLEISRLIGRSLRAAVDLNKMGERQITVDCDVLHADGGTRTASITGGFVALALALKKLRDLREIKTLPLVHYVAAVSAGIFQENCFLDLNYDEDSQIHTDMNFIMNEEGRFIEIQGTGEKEPFSLKDLNNLLLLGERGCRYLMEIQSQIIGDFFPLVLSPPAFSGNRGDHEGRGV